MRINEGSNIKAKLIDDVDSKILYQFIDDNVANHATIFTDKW